jgi:hypothetical protein
MDTLLQDLRYAARLRVCSFRLLVAFSDSFLPGPLSARF